MKIIEFAEHKNGILILEPEEHILIYEIESIVKKWCEDQGINKTTGDFIYEYIERDTTFFLNPKVMEDGTVRFYFKYIYRPNPVVRRGL